MGHSKDPSSSSSRIPSTDERKMEKMTIRHREVERNIDNLDIDEILEKICDGKQAIVTVKGSSQYGDKLGNRISASTCGLAALNFARIAFKLEVDEGMQGLEVLNELLSRKTNEEITSICDYWKSDSHLEIEELLKVPIFKNSLSLQTCTYSDASKQRFYDLLQDLEDISPHRSVAVIITRPPEIVACLRIRVAERDVYVVFDSHPRPSHPDGLGFIINPSIKIAASYLSELLSFDENILNDPSLQWHAQLLGYFSGHILSPLEEEPSTTEMLLEASSALLSAYADVAHEKSRVSELRQKVEELERQQHFMEERVRHLEQRRREESERYREALRSHGRYSDRDRQYQRTDSSEFRSNSYYPSTSNSSSSAQSAHRRSSHGGDETDGWQTVKRRDKGKGPIERVVSYGLALSGKWNQPPGRDKSPPPTEQRIKPPVNPAMPGGLPEPFQTISDLDRDIALAMNLQQTFEAEDRQLAAQREMLQRMAPVVFQCSICFEDYVEDSIARVEGCSHPFCRECLRNYAKTKVAERRFPILCPVCITDKDTRDPGAINEIIIQQIGVSDDDYRIFEELQITSFCIPIHCRRCKQTMFVDRQEVQETKLITCPWPRCGYVWCKSCQQQIEVGGPQHSCDGSSELRHLMQQQGWKNCPGCQTPVQKSEGCNHMTCITPACNTHFCYIDGGMIIKGGTRSEIGNAINAHYTKCKLFDYN